MPNLDPGAPKRRNARNSTRRQVPHDRTLRRPRRLGCGVPPVAKGPPRLHRARRATPQEWSTGIIPSAKLIDIKSPDFDDKIAQLDKSKTYLVYCRTGNRSGTACGKLHNLDMSAYNLKGGIVAWKAANLPTTQPSR